MSFSYFQHKGRLGVYLSTLICLWKNIWRKLCYGYQVWCFQIWNSGSYKTSRHIHKFVSYFMVLRNILKLMYQMVPLQMHAWLTVILLMWRM